MDAESSDLGARDAERARVAEKTARTQLALFEEWLRARAARGDNLSQRSAAWYARRRECVGASQLGKLETEAGAWQVARSVAGLVPRINPPPCLWGNLLEPYSEAWVEALGGEVRNAGSLLSRALPGHACSPDGVAALDLRKLRAHWTPGAAPPTPGPAFVVLEYKNAWSRALGGPPPRHYVVQSQAGVLAVPLARAAVLLEFEFRRCGLDEWGWNSLMNPDLGRSQARAPPGAPLALGCLGFLPGPCPPLPLTAVDPECAELYPFADGEPDEAERRADAVRLLQEFRRDLRAEQELRSGQPGDLGAASYKLFVRGMWLASLGVLRVRRLRLRFPAAPLPGAAQLSDTSFGPKTPLAVLPLKLFRVAATYVPGDRQKILSYAARVQLVLQHAQLLRDAAEAAEAAGGDEAARDEFARAWAALNSAHPPSGAPAPLAPS